MEIKEENLANKLKLVGYIFNQDVQPNKFISIDFGLLSSSLRARQLYILPHVEVQRLAIFEKDVTILLI
jgi:hypothetical protein